MPEQQNVYSVFKPGRQSGGVGYDVYIVYRNGAEKSRDFTEKAQEKEENYQNTHVYKALSARFFGKTAKEPVFVRLFAGSSAFG